MPPHSLVLSFIGACLLWVGWFGFNGGSQLALGTAAAVLIFGPGAGVLAALIGGAAAAGVGHLARRQIGGSTGDVLGAVQQVSEGAILLVAVAAY